MAFYWLLYLFIVGLIIGITSIAILFRKKSPAQDNSSTQQKYIFTKKILPINRSSGWQLLDISQGMRVWQRTKMDSESWISGKIYGSYTIISASVQDVMDTLRDPSLLQEWDPSVQQVSNVTLGDDSDVLSVLPQKRDFLWQVAAWLGQMFDEDTNINTSRYWQFTEDKEGWMFLSSMQHNLFYNEMRSTFFTITSLDTGNSSAECVVSIIACPSNSDHLGTICQLTGTKLAGLKDYFECCRVKELYPVKQDEEPKASVAASDNDEGSSESISDSKGKILTEVKAKKNKHSDMHRGKLPGQTRYQNQLEQVTKSVMDAYEAVEGVDHWVLLGNIKGVHILKRPAQPGERPWESFKGTITVNVPIHYVLEYGFSLDTRGEWDDMYNSGEVIEQFDPLARVSRMEFKPVWPSTARDMCIIAAVMDLGEGLFGIICQSVEHDNCPERKGFVRAELLMAGFMVKEESSDPPSCQVSYISKADLKGNLPVRIVNRVAQSQPQSLAVFRNKLEAMYSKDLGNATDEKSPFQKKALDLWRELMKVRKVKQKDAVSSEDKDSAVAESDTSDLLTGEGSSDSLKSECGQHDSDFEQDSYDTLAVTDENMKLPLMDRQIDYRTLGNQAAATLLGELVLASKIEISLGTTENPQPSEKEGEWSFQMVEKDVVILKKLCQGEKIQSFLGKGLIKATPLTVWQAVTNQMTRYVYDKTLKKLKIVKQIDEQTKIQYQHHEAAQCFVKQARDFVILVSERVEAERYVSAGVSIDFPDCPPQKNLIRGKIMAAGWVIEPVLQNGQLHSMVSYMCQIDFGGSVPIRLLNYVSRRQPLCIAYLRDYLERFDES